MPSPLQLVALVASAFAAGAVNSIAGGGTLLTFPTLLWAGVPPIAANATSTVALVPGSAGAFWGYRQDLRSDTRSMVALALPSVLGGLAGTLLVIRAGDELFARLVPFLILGATALFVAAEPIGRAIRRRSAPPAGTGEPPARPPGATGEETPAGTPGATGEGAPSAGHLVALFVFQGLVAVYGGFFGAGIGILMLAALAIAGFHDVHRMNALKNFAAICINGVSAVTFALEGRVQWPIALVMAAGAIAGGRAGASVARRVGQRNVRRAVVAIGLGIAVLMLLRPLR